MQFIEPDARYESVAASAVDRAIRDTACRFVKLEDARIPASGCVERNSTVEILRWVIEYISEKTVRVE